MILIKCVLQQFAKVYKGFTMNVLLISNLNQFDPVLNTINAQKQAIRTRKRASLEQETLSFTGYSTSHLKIELF
jgi:hypothetical protein